MASLFHDQDRAAIQRIPRGGQDCPEPRDYMRRARVLESKQDDSRHPVVRESSDLAEIEIEGEDDTILGESLGEDLLVGRPV